MESPTPSTISSRSRWPLVGIGLALVIVVVAAFFASSDPDGLERVAEDTGFLGAAEGSPFAIIADYVFPGLDGPAATIAAGAIGVLVLVAVVWLLGRLLARRRA